MITPLLILGVNHSLGVNHGLKRSTYSFPLIGLFTVCLTVCYYSTWKDLLQDCCKHPVMT